MCKKPQKGDRILAEYTVGDVVETKKSHPCGCSEWEVLRTGADFKLKCMGCGRIIMLSYEDFKKRVRRKVK